MKKVKGWCPSCKGEEFVHIGTQKGYGYTQDFELYVCCRCGTSLSLKTISTQEGKDNLRLLSEDNLF